jgi:hypothetical protein
VITNPLLISLIETRGDLSFSWIDVCTAKHQFEEAYNKFGSRQEPGRSLAAKPQRGNHENVRTLNQDLLDEVTRRLAAEFQPEQIWLVGSHAWGQPDEESDLDLLVVVRDSDMPPGSAGSASPPLPPGLGDCQGHSGEDPGRIGAVSECSFIPRGRDSRARAPDLWMTPRVNWCVAGSLINTSLQRGEGRARESSNRFSGFWERRQ